MHYQFITAIRSLILEKIQNREHYAVNARKKKKKSLDRPQSELLVVEKEKEKE
jgi:hypothetical protein